MLTVGSLFSGCGGLDLGLERAGLKTIWQVENYDYARAILAKHWPDVPCHDDIHTFPKQCTFTAKRPDVIAGGFPCQDVSGLGKRIGIGGKQSGLWSEFVRIIRILRPRYVVIENVSALLVRGFGTVMGDLANIGFDAEWGVLQAADFGLPHRRSRLFIIAYANSQPQWSEREWRLPACKRVDWKRLVHGSGGRDDDGPAFRVDRKRIKLIGNSVCPAIGEWLGKRILENEIKT